MKHFRYNKPNRKEIPTIWLAVSATALGILAFFIALAKYWITLG